MKNRIKMLKVKIKSLAAEAAIIRTEERRAASGSQLQGELHGHRVNDVRREQRLSLLAYAFLRGIPLERVEAANSSRPDWARVQKLVEKFGATGYAEQRNQAFAFIAWKACREPVAA